MSGLFPGRPAILIFTRGSHRKHPNGGRATGYRADIDYYTKDRKEFRVTRDLFRSELDAAKAALHSCGNLYGREFTEQNAVVVFSDGTRKRAIRSEKA